MELYDLCVLKNTLGCKKFAIIIEDFYPKYYIVELWIFENNNGAEIKSFSPNELRLANDFEKEEFKLNFEKYCSDCGSE